MVLLLGAQLTVFNNQYLDPIIAATYHEDGAVSDVCRALAPRIREPNAVVSSAEVFQRA